MTDYSIDAGRGASPIWRVERSNDWFQEANSGLEDADFNQLANQVDDDLARGCSPKGGCTGASTPRGDNPREIMRKMRDDLSQYREGGPEAKPAGRRFVEGVVRLKTLIQHDVRTPGGHQSAVFYRLEAVQTAIAVVIEG